MGLEILTLGSSKTYTRESLLGGGAVVGKNVTISSITPIDGGNKVTFSYTLDDGTVKTSSMNVMDGKDGIDGTNGKNGKDGHPGKDGSDGIGISKIEKIGTVDLVDTYRITFTDNSTFDYEVKNGADGTGGEGASTWSEISDKPFESLSTDFSVENGELKVVGGTGGSGEENKINSISVNGSPISADINKNVDITVPTVTNDLTDELKSSYDDAVTAKHTHENGTVLDGITAEKVESWDKAEENVQSDWNETDDTADGFIKNKPTIPDITGLATETYVDNKVADYTKTVDLADVATSGSYNDLADKPIIPSLDDYAKTSEIPTKVSQLENDSNYLSSIPEEYVTETELNAKGYLTEHQDLSNYATKDELPSLDGYATEDYVTEQISNIPSVDLTDYAKKNEIPDVSGYITEEQLLAKDYADKAYVTEEIAKASTGGEIDLSSYLSKVEATETYVTKESGKSLIADTEIERLASVDNYDDTEIDNRIRAIEDDYIKNTDLAAVAKSGSYNDLNDKPEFETVNIDFTTEY